MPNQRKRKALIGIVNFESEIFKSATSLSEQSLTNATELLSIWGMTTLQYNALHTIYVKDIDDTGISSKEIGAGLYTRVPDVTRLLDRMVDKGWITRERDPQNKRVVRSRLTDIGVELVESAHLPMIELETNQLNHLSDDEKKALFELLNKVLSR